MIPEAYSLSLGTRLSLRARGSMVTLWAETGRFGSDCRYD